MSGKGSISRVASACRPCSQCALQFQRGHHTLGSSLFKTVYFIFSSIFEELASIEPSPLPQIPKDAFVHIFLHTSNCLLKVVLGFIKYILSGLHKLVCSGSHVATRLLGNQHIQGRARLEPNCYLKRAHSRG